jgi:hypothetical protein
VKPDELVKLVSLFSNKEHLHAYEVARYLKRGDNEAAYGMMGLFDCNPQFLKLVLDAYNGTSKFEPTPTCVNIIKAWVSVDPWQTGPDNPRTVAEVKAQFIRLFPRVPLPAHFTFTSMLTRLKLPWRKDPGRPTGSKDKRERKPRKDKGKPRKNSQRKSPH